MRNPFRFSTELLQQPIGIPIWVFALMVINTASVVFWSEPLAKLIFVIFMISAMLMMALHFVRVREDSRIGPPPLDSVIDLYAGKEKGARLPFP